VTALAAIGGTLYAVWEAVDLQPARAMQPEPPATYRATIVERLGLQSVFDPPTRMILRHLERRPLNALLTVIGIAASVAVLMAGIFFGDAMEFLTDVQFNQAQRQDLTVTFTGPTGNATLSELRHLRGVAAAEPFRSAPVRLRHEHRRYRTALEGLVPDPSLRRPLNAELQPIPVPPRGVMLSDYLADVLAVERGDTLTVEMLTGRRLTRRVPVAGRTTQFIGVGAYMQLGALNRLLREGRVLSGAYLALAPGSTPSPTLSALAERPRVAGVQAQGRALESFIDTIGDTVLTFTFVMTLFAGAIAFGVIYNAARISLSERARELASLRILGLTRGEPSWPFRWDSCWASGSATPPCSRRKRSSSACRW
jgi:putative ABC transport system permease protein